MLCQGDIIHTDIEVEQIGKGSKIVLSDFSRLFMITHPLKDSEFTIKAHQICTNFLGAEWSNIENFEVETLQGGLTNKLYLCHLKECDELHNKYALRNIFTLHNILNSNKYIL